jgi:hypothetical protein
LSVKKLKLVTEKANAEDKVLFFKELKTLEMDLCKSDEIIHNLIPSLL